MWYFVVFQPFKCRNAHIQHRFGQFDILPQFGHLIRFPNDSESMLHKLKSSEILSRVEALVSSCSILSTGFITVFVLALFFNTFPSYICTFSQRPCQFLMRGFRFYTN